LAAGTALGFYIVWRNREKVQAMAGAYRMPLGRLENNELWSAFRRYSKEVGPILFELGLFLLEVRRPILGRLARGLVNLSARIRS